METKQFPLRTVLSVVTGRLLTERKSSDDNGIGNIYEILDWMTDDSVYTHTIPRFIDECKPYLLQWFPTLQVAINDLHILDEMLAGAKQGSGDPDDGIQTYIGWLRGERELLPFYDVPKIPKDDHTAKEPAQELAEIKRSDQEIIIGTA